MFKNSGWLLDKDGVMERCSIHNLSVNSMWIENVGEGQNKIIPRKVSKEPKIRELSNGIFAFKKELHNKELRIKLR